MTAREQGDQIRIALSELPTLEIEEDGYLKLEDALDVTKTILYPEGLRLEEEYNRLVAITKAGCRAIGYSDEEVALLRLSSKSHCLGRDKLLGSEMERCRAGQR